MKPLDATDRLVLIGLVGLASLVRGVAMVSTPAAFIVLGLVLLGWFYRMTWPRREKS